VFRDFWEDEGAYEDNVVVGVRVVEVVVVVEEEEEAEEKEVEDKRANKCSKNAPESKKYK